MPRRGTVQKRDILPDPVYNSELVARFINKLMMKGKKRLAESILYGAFDIIRAKTGSDPIETFEKAVKNVMPVVEVKPRRVGGATYQVPVEVRPERRVALAVRWIVENARNRGEYTMKERLAAEFMDASNGVGASIKKKDDTHRLAEANRAFAHYRW